MNQLTTRNTHQLIDTLADQYCIDPAKFLTTVKETVFQNATDSELALFLMVANKYDLNPFTGQIYPYKSKNGKMHIIVGVDGWSKIVNMQRSLDGINFIENFDDEKKLFSITCEISIKHRKHPVIITEYLSECMMDTPSWRKWPIRSLRHKTFIQCARIAFGLGEIVDDDEAKRIK